MLSWLACLVGNSVPFIFPKIIPRQNENRKLFLTPKLLNLAPKKSHKLPNSERFRRSGGVILETSTVKDDFFGPNLLNSLIYYQISDHVSTQFTK